jgi:hypothetical protein
LTTFHDQQPQSRRAVRQSERAEGAEKQAGFPGAPTTAPQQYSAPAGDMWDTVSRRAAQLPPASLTEEAPAGRRAATPPAPQGEPLNYSTQSRPALPSHDGPSFRARGTAAPQPVPFDPTTQSQAPAGHEADQPAYRVRDFSPEARSATADSRWREPDPAPTAPVGPAADLDYRTEARFRAAAAAAPLAPISEVPASVAPINKLWAAPEATPEPERPAVRASSDYPLEQTYTRRELRAMQQAEDAALLQSQQPSAQQPSAQQPSEQQPEPVAPPMSAAPSFPLVEPRVGPPPALPPTAVLPTALTPAAPVTPPAPASPTFIPAAPVSSSPFDSLFTPPAPAQPEPVAEVPSEIAPAPVADAPSPWTPPTGHWSTQLDVEDDDIETTISRRIGSGSTATSALVLPAIPNGTDIRGPLTSTGGIMLTGSIDLPRNLSATGQSDRFDNGIDELFDLSDAEITSTDSSPVRAIRAVSTHTSGHGVTHTQKPKGTRALTALLIAASSMAVVVAGLLVAAFAFNVFG